MPKSKLLSCIKSESSSTRFIIFSLLSKAKKNQANNNSGGVTKWFNDAKNLSLQKTVELKMEPILQSKNNNFSILEALKEVINIV